MAQVDDEQFRSLITTSQEAIKTTILVNGGGAVALLAFAGHLVAQGRSVGFVSWAILLFALGVAAGCWTSILAYLAQYGYAHVSDQAGDRCRQWAIGLGCVSGGLFVAGCVVATLGLRTM